METENKSGSNKRLIIILAAIIIIVAIVAVASVVILTNSKDSGNSTVNIGDGNTPKIGYAESVIAVDEDSLQKAVDEMFTADDGQFVTEYKNNAASTDGENFTCYIGNSPLNTYDMYIQIFADNDYTDQIFLSELLRPGTAFDHITLEHPLDPGDHTVYVAFTQVGEDLASIVGQVVVTMDFTVTE